jgi:hypothetical protein
MQRVKGNEQDHSSERVENSAQKKLNTSLTESALLEMDGNATNRDLSQVADDDTVSLAEHYQGPRQQPPAIRANQWF